MKTKKGVSPVVATVLLIVIVLIIIAMIIFWVRKLSQEAYTKEVLDKYLSDRQACDEVRLTASYSNSNLQITNNGNVPIKSFDYEVKINGEEETTDASIGLPSGNTASVSISGTGIEEINIYPILLVTGSDGGNHDFKCENKFTAEII